MRWRFSEFHNLNDHKKSGLEGDFFQESGPTTDFGSKSFPLRAIDIESKKLVDVAPLIRINSKDQFSYAVLSHAWGSAEVIYSDLESGATLDQLGSKKEGKAKLLGSVNAAKELGLKYIWADTCCIDKANYTELAESIASMGQWYMNADVCVVYLGDIEHESLPEVSKYDDDPRKPNGYEGTRWSSRGWTLQEIVMCRKAVFYNALWTKIACSGPQSDKDISRICSLPSDTVCFGRPPPCAASDILSWAATRKTTKPEDRAYSLMGILDTVVTIRYGEGLERALSRLIEAVVRGKGDVTVFNWAGKDYGRSMYPSSLLAYQNSGVVAQERTVNPVSISNLGVCSMFDVIPVTLEWDSRRRDDNHSGCDLAIALDNGSYTADYGCEKSTLSSVSALMERFGARSQDECIATGILLIPNQNQTLEVRLVCPLWMLKTYAQYRDLREYIDENDADTLHKGWVVARFANTPNADWFLYQFIVLGPSLYVGLRIPTDTSIKLEYNLIPTRSLAVQMHMVT